MKFSVQALYDWYRQTIRNPKYRWWIILATAAYLISPIDIAPDFIPIIGQIDDVVLITLLVSEISQLLIDRVKTGKDQSVPSSEPVNQAATSADPVDVNAVSVE
ncbi:MAG: YkvA family protein [Oculatellaceae cyanobacterium bins.114]|nr:YkvA family protein [Oculatellaceae cyanobacterium bins.114]